MSGLKGIARVPRAADPRLRRAMQRLGNDASSLATGALTVNSDGEFAINFATGEPFAQTSAGITLTLSGNSLEKSGDALRVKEVTTVAASTHTTVSLTSVTDPGDAPADADALRDDLVANALAELQTRDTELQTSVQDLAATVNAILTALKGGDLMAT